MTFEEAVSQVTALLPRADPHDPDPCADSCAWAAETLRAAHYREVAEAEVRGFNRWVGYSMRMAK